MHGTLLLALSFVIIYATRKFLAFREAVRLIQDHPGPRLVLSPLIGTFLPKIKYFTAGSNHAYEDRHEKFAAAGWDIYVTEVTNSRARFPKPVHHYGVLSFYGDNIVASEGEQWKKYRKICKLIEFWAFDLFELIPISRSALVWDETVDVVRGLCDDHWEGRKVIEVDNFVDISLSVRPDIINSTPDAYILFSGFGKKISWKDDAEPPAGHLMTFKESMRIVTADIMFKIACPGWMMSLTKRLRRARLAFKELRSYMVEMIEERQKSQKTEHHDLFTGLLRENDHAVDFSTLTEDELIGNVYVFLVAGHEVSTGHTLAFTFALLALYPDEQEKLLEQIRSVIPEGHDPKYRDMNLLTYATAVMYESMRMYPVLNHIPKTSIEDTTLVATNSNGDKITVPVPKGTDINILAAGLHYNPRYWEDPHSFRPARFLKDWPRDAFFPFSAGARACLGKKYVVHKFMEYQYISSPYFNVIFRFFETEAVATLAMLVSRYKITIKEEPQFAGETFEQRKTRVMACERFLTTVYDTFFRGF
ncbi:hypothetical protein CVT25_003216 [Psilocybe cyanescens]|uniref:Cytochrome P450 n=1 Tax=Psilocybe cyanescens TaxID=93625 RepID=A0A409WME3_PSICY|nr:hypothetical protein CVT25_003216 [Psilocybe cyanescens]